MWDKLRIRERDRRLARLFLGVMAVVFAASLLALGFPMAGRAAAVLGLGICWLVAIRRLAELRQGKWGPAPVGPLSPDEKAKARSKLLGPRRPQVLYR